MPDWEKLDRELDQALSEMSDEDWKEWHSKRNIKHLNQNKMSEEILELIGECREMLESKGECCPVYVSFDKDEYSFTKEEIRLLSRCLYLADCEIFDLKGKDVIDM